MSYELSQRDRRVLKAVILEYIRNAEPVGSRTLAKRYTPDISAATIRNVMADLEDLGLLAQPHASAGRIPTQQGLRYYVDTILEVQDVPGEDQEVIRRQLTGLAPEVEQVIRYSSKVLSSVSRQVGVVLAPRFSILVLKQLQFVRLSPRLLLAILVGRSGMVQNRLIEIEEDSDQETLDRYNRYLCDILEGLTISEIRTRLLEEMREEKNRFDLMFSQALTLSHKVFANQTIQDAVYMDGQVNLLDNPEFADVTAMKRLFAAFEDKGVMVKLLDKTLTASGVQIFIGSENESAPLGGCTVITSSYSRGSRPLGTLGVIGPTRLNYSRIIPVVDFTAKLVSHILESTI